MALQSPAALPWIPNHRPQILLMFLQAKRVFASALFAALVTLSCFAQSAPSNSFEGIQIELPASGRIRIENQFGGVAARKGRVLRKPEEYEHNEEARDGGGKASEESGPCGVHFS